MADRTNNLTPGAIAVADYGIANGPALGAERDVYLTSKLSNFLGILTFKADAAGAGDNGYFELIARPTGSDPILAFVMTELRADAAAVLTWNGLTATFKPVEYSSLGGYSFPATRGVELIGTEGSGVASVTVGTPGTGYTSAPTVTFTNGGGTGAEGVAVLNGTGGIASVTITKPGSGYTSAPTIGFTGGSGSGAAATATISVAAGFAGALPTLTNVKRGTKIGFVQVPALTNYTKVGLTTAKDITVPVRTAKAIANGMDSTRYVKPGRTSEGSLRITARDIGEDEGLRRFAGLKCTAMIETMKEEAILTSRAICTNFVPPLRSSNGDQDDPASNDSEGFFQHMITLLAPGTP